MKRTWHAANDLFQYGLLGLFYLGLALGAFGVLAIALAFVGVDLGALVGLDGLAWQETGTHDSAPYRTP